MQGFLTIRSKFIVAALFIGVIELIGCSSSTERTEHQAKLSGDVAPGVILIDVLGIGVSESGQPEHYYQYEVQPATGLVRKVKEERFQDYKHRNIPDTFYEPTGAIEGCRKGPQASSRDGEYWAYCRRGEADQFFVDHKKTAQSLYHGTLGDRRGIHKENCPESVPRNAGRQTWDSRIWMGSQLSLSRIPKFVESLWQDPDGVVVRPIRTPRASRHSLSYHLECADRANDRVLDTERCTLRVY